MKIDLGKLQKEEADRQTLVHEILEIRDDEERKAAIKDLISVLESEEFSNSAKATAVYTLGELRAVEAVNTLINLCDVSLIDFGEKSPYLKSDAPEALIKIGQPGKDALIKALESSEDMSTRTTLAIILYHLVGGKEKLKQLVQKCAEKSLERDRTRSVNNFEELQREIDRWRED